MIVRPGERELNTGWRFQFQDEPPQMVTLPHSWNATDTMSTDPAHHYRRGRGTYTLAFEPLPADDNQRVWVRFGAVAQRCWVYFNDEPIGEHHGGYTAFTVEVPNRAGTLRVVADNTPDANLIPSDMSDFYLYGGITRSVTCYTTGATRLDRALFDITTTAERAQVNLHGRVDGPLDDLQLTVKLWEPGREAVVYTRTFELRDNRFDVNLPDVLTPQLWSTATPHLYPVQLFLYAGDALLDTYETGIGFRWFGFPEGGPFYLNGKRLLLRGTHRHDDWAGYGAAVPREMVQQELEQIKAAGFNFIRLGHYPQDDDTLHLCDTLGLIVWEELPWCRGGVGGDVFKRHARAMLTDMIEQHYNSPSVVFWGLGNELDWEAEHEGSTDEKVAAFLNELHDLSHQLDPRRLTALRRFEQGAAVVDVYSPSIWSGWYRGRYPDYERVLTQAMSLYPRLLHIEWGGDSHIGRHNDGPHISAEVESEGDHGEVPGTATSDEGFARYSRDGDWSESYMIDLMAHHLAVQARLPRLAGTAQWVFKDFGTPLRPENPVPYVNQKGLVTRDGTPKDVYRVFCAFQVSEPVVHIESAGWELRTTDGDTPQRVRVVSNCERVGLMINGKAEGAQIKQDASAPAEIFTWEVTLAPGEIMLEAIGYQGRQPVARHRVQQPVALGGEPPVAGYTLTHTENRLVVQLVDAAGHPVTTEERRVQFSGGVARHQGTMGGSDVIETANGRAWVMLRGAEPVQVTIDGLNEITHEHYQSDS